MLLDSHQKIFEMVANIAKLHQLENVEITSDSEQETIKRIHNFIQSLLDEEELKQSEMSNQIQNEIKLQQEIIQQSITQLHQNEQNLLEFINLLKTSETEQKDLQKRLDSYQARIHLLNSKKELIEKQVQKEEQSMENAINAVDSALPLLMKIIETAEEDKEKKQEGFLTSANKQNNDLQSQLQNDIFPLFQTSCSNPIIHQIFQSSLTDKKLTEESIRKLVKQIQTIKQRFNENLRENQHKYQQEREEIDNELKAQEQVYKETLAYRDGKSKVSMEQWKQKIQELELSQQTLKQTKSSATTKLQSLQSSLNNLYSQSLTNSNKLKEELRILQQCEQQLQKL